MKNNSITITYLSKVSFASLNGGDKEVDNIVPIKKITLANGDELPYVSSQAIRRALRDRLADFGFELSPVGGASAEKGAAKTALDPTKYIDDDLFGYMDAAPGKNEKEKGTATVRTSPIRVEALLALTEYKGDLDYGTNFMGKGKTDAKGKEIQPNIFETEIHSGIYRGTVLIELDRIGRENGFEKGDLSEAEKCKRVLAFIDAFRNLWSSGRQSRFLSDISPKFIAAAYMKAKNPIFLEAVKADSFGSVNTEELQTVVEDYQKFIEDHVLAGQKAVFDLGKHGVGLEAGFAKIEGWVKKHYGQAL